MNVRILGRLEKVLLVVLGAAAFVFYATTVAPGTQAVVADFACPEGTTRAAVVRYPRVAEPVEMVRTTPLVCVLGDRAVIASAWRVLPGLAGVGLAGTGAVVVALSGAVAVARRGTWRPDLPAPPGTPFDGIRWLPLAISMPFVCLTSFGAYWWLAVDTPYRVTTCRGSNGGSATCFDGEPAYRMQTLLFAALALIGLTIWAVAVHRAHRRTRRFHHLWTEGVKATATVVDRTATATKVNGRRVHRCTYEVEPADGSPPFRFTERVDGRRVSAVGAKVAALYDRDDPGIAFSLPPDLAAASGAAVPDPVASFAPGR